MLWRISFWLVLFLGLLLAGSASAQPYQNYQLTDGKVFSGRTVQFTDGFVQFALETPSGTYTNIRWGRLSQASLVELAKNRFAAPHATPFIDTPPSPRPAPDAKPELTIKPVPRMDRPSGGGLFDSPVMLLLFFMIYLGNIYAAFEISIFRQQNSVMVCGLAAILPILGPIIFLAIPTRPLAQLEEAPPEAPPPPVEHYTLPVVEEYAPPPPPPPPTGPVIPDPVVFQRGTSTFNRRFFETKMASFLRVVPAESDRDMVVFVKSSRGDYAGRRISKIGPSDLSLLVQKGNASEEIMIPFVEINEVHIKHKDA